MLSGVRKYPRDRALRYNGVRMWSRQRIYCNRTLNFRSLAAIGYDMDYTLIHYHVPIWEEHAYVHVLGLLKERGWPVEGLEFRPDLIIRGLVVDTELGNVVKPNRFGFIKQACHGTQVVPFDSLRHTYSRVIIDLAGPRWRFLNTFFSVSEGLLFMQLVDRLDEGRLSEVGSYRELYDIVRVTIDRAHLEGRLKDEVIGNPERFVDLDENVPLALLDQHQAKKKLILITNSGWSYTQAMMSYAFDRFLPGAMTWRDLFHIVIVEARKPSFFINDNPVFEVIDEQGRLVPSYEGLRVGGTFLGGNAHMVEAALGVSGDQILYVGDHLFSDVNVSKQILRWRTALVVRELADELDAIEDFEDRRTELERLMVEKEQLEREQNQVRRAQLRLEGGYGPAGIIPAGLDERATSIKSRLESLDETIAPLAAAAATQGNSRWGLLMRAGNDKSHLARQVERYADIYISRVGDLADATPFAYLRSARGTLPHDPV